MCSPTLMISAAMNGMKMMQSMQQQKNAREQAIRQNARAKKNRIIKSTAEDFKIRQKRKEAHAKIYAMKIKGRKARATAFTMTEGMGGGSVNQMLMDYFRQEGEYTSRVESNLSAEAHNSMQAKKAYRLQQDYQTKSVPHVEILPTFASSAFNYAGDYYDWKSGQEEKLRAKRQAATYG